MRKNKRNTDAIGILLMLFVFPIIVYWKEIIIVIIMFFIAKIIYKIIKLIYGYSSVDEYNQVSENVYEKKEYEGIQNDRLSKKGTEAELKIVRILERIYPKENIIHDAYFRDVELVTTQVDIIAIDVTGIYVIESKNFSGIICGKSNVRTWAQLFSGKRYNHFLNPIYQNECHIEDIKENLKCYNLPNEAFKSYVVFGNECKLDVVIEGSCKTKVLKIKELFYTILADRENTKNLLTENQVEEIARRLRAHANVNEELKTSHIMRRKNHVKYRVKG